MVLPVRRPNLFHRVIATILGIGITLMPGLNELAYAAQPPSRGDAANPSLPAIKASRVDLTRLDVPPSSAAMIRLPGHVLKALARAKLIRLAPDAAEQPIILTVVLKREDQAGFASYLHDVYDSHSPIFHQFLTPKQVSDRFGPSPLAYDTLWRYLRENGFTLIEGSTDRLTLTVRGTRSQAEQAFGVSIKDFEKGGRIFFANDRDPSVPLGMATQIAAVTGLTNIAVPEPQAAPLPPVPIRPGPWGVPFELRQLSLDLLKQLYQLIIREGGAAQAIEFENVIIDGDVFANISINLIDVEFALSDLIVAELAASPALNGIMDSRIAFSDLGQSRPNGSGEKIGLLAFSSFQPSDVANWLALTGQPSGLLSHVSRVDVAGGAPQNGDESDVLLGIEAALLTAPGAQVIVYDGPSSGNGVGFEALINKMISDGVNVVSNTFSYCEDQTTAADVQSIDAVLATAAASGISVFNGAGDFGSMCSDGSANTVAVPADSPHTTAVGASSLTFGPGFTYAGETWLDGSSQVPPGPQGGFGVSEFFARPHYQDGVTTSPMRSVPDVVAPADPSLGLQVCQADAGGCPTGTWYGGTSIATPTWAGFAAVLNQALGGPLGLLNPQIYRLAKSDAFHSAASMGTDTTHVGLGSPNLNRLALALAQKSVGPVDASASSINGFSANPFVPYHGSVPANGLNTATLLVTLFDANGNMVSGKTVTLSASSGSSAVVTPSSAVSSVDNGAAVFTVKNAVVEPVTFTAKDITDNITLAKTVLVDFTGPPAAAAGIEAFPTTVTANGTNTATITVTMQDSSGRPAVGKLVNIAQGGGHSIISGPSPSLTNNAGQIEFTAVDQFDETVTCSATDLTDGNIPFPATASVNFINSPNNGCGTPNPVPAPGFQVAAFATGFLQQSFSYLGVSATCGGAFGMAFDQDGNLYVSDQPTGNIYKFPPGGGVAEEGLLTKTPLGPGVIGLVIDKDGNLYAGRNATTASFGTGVILQIDPSTGDVIRTVASGLTCPALFAQDPLSGDLFADDNCFGGGLNNSSLWRISNPTSAAPSVSIYATLPGSPNGTIAFAPDGTMYILATVGGQIELLQVSGTSEPSPPTVSVVPLSVGPLGLLAKGMQADGAAQYLIGNFPMNGSIPGGVGIFDLTTSPPSMSNTLLTSNSAVVGMIQGPDGCVYGAQGDAVVKITDDSGECHYAPKTQPPALSLSPTGTTISAQQGTSEAFTATFHYVNVPAGTPVTLDVVGNNLQILLGQTNSSGQATFSYVGTFAGNDVVAATATLGSQHLVSNNTEVNWSLGFHSTFLTLNLSPKTAMPGEPITLIGSLFDASENPAVPVFDQPIALALGNDSCVASTDQNGNANCQVNPEIIPGNPLRSLTATFAGAGFLNPAQASAEFQFTAPPEEHRLRVRPRVLHFGHVEIGTTSETKLVRVFNPTRKKKKITLTFLGAENTGDFTIISGPPTTCDDNLAPKQRCDIALTFSPTAAGKRKGAMVVYDNAERNEPQKVKLRGVGLPAGESSLAPDDSEITPDDSDDDPTSP
jgi:hypothetical protein